MRRMRTDVGRRHGAGRLLCMLALASGVAIAGVVASTHDHGDVGRVQAQVGPYVYFRDSNNNVIGTFAFTPSPSATSFTVFLTYHLPGSADWTPLPGASQDYTAPVFGPVPFHLDTSALPAEANSVRIENTLTSEKSDSFVCSQLPEATPTPESTSTARGTATVVRTASPRATVSATTGTPTGDDTPTPTPTAGEQSTETATPTSTQGEVSTATPTSPAGGGSTATPTTTGAVIASTATPRGTAVPAATGTPTPVRTISVLQEAGTPTATPRLASGLPNAGGGFDGRSVIALVFVLAGAGTLLAIAAGEIRRRRVS